MHDAKKSLFRALRSPPASHGPLQVAICFSYELMIRFGQDFTRWPFARLHGGLVRASPLLTPPSRSRPLAAPVRPVGFTPFWLVSRAQFCPPRASPRSGPSGGSKPPAEPVSAGSRGWCARALRGALGTASRARMCLSLSGASRDLSGPSEGGTACDPHV